MNKRNAPALLALLLAATAHGAELSLDANGNAGVFPVPGGTWDFAGTVLWTDDGGATRRAWTSNDDSILIELPDAASVRENVTVASDASHGAVGPGSAGFSPR